MLALEKVSIAFGGVQAVQDVSFTIAPGRVSSLIGGNGAGKTTVFNLITGLLKPSAGAIEFEGTDITGWAPHRVTRAGIGRTFQITRELGELTLLENVVVQSPAGGLRGLIGRSILDDEEARAMELLEFVGLASLAHEQARSLSYGQKKLLELAGMLMARPSLVMLDEPAGGINPRLLDDIIDRIRELNADGVTFLIVEHNMDVIMGLSDSVVVMAHGEVLLQDSPAAVQVDDAVLDAYLGRV